MIEIDKILYEASREGYSPTDIKEAILYVLSPYFDKAFTDGICHVLKCYKNAYNKSKNEFWDIILCSYDQMINDENKMWTVRKAINTLDNNDFYEKVLTYMNLIGANLEITAKHITQEIYALVRISKSKNVDYSEIRKLDFGVIINNILNQNLLNNELIIFPLQIKLSDWRNIAYHHSFLVSGDKLKCSFGKKITKEIELTMKEFECYVHQIIRTCNIFTIARC